MTIIWIESVSIFGPGLMGWEASTNVLRDLSGYDAHQVPVIESRFLAPNNKRRTSPHMHMAVQAADYALQKSSVDEKTVELVFATSMGDLEISHDILMSLTQPEKEVSPQKFQNVILNAAAGHLGIFMSNSSGSSSISGEGNSFSVALLHAYATLVNNADAVLLVAYDARSETPYATEGRTFFGVGLVLRKTKPDNALAGLKLGLTVCKDITTVDHPFLENIRKATPSATCLPLLISIAQKKNERVTLYYSDELGLKVDVCF